jgi:hypothetical protein
MAFAQAASAQVSPKAPTEAEHSKVINQQATANRLKHQQLIEKLTAERQQHAQLKTKLDEDRLAHARLNEKLTAQRVAEAEKAKAKAHDSVH